MRTLKMYPALLRAYWHRTLIYRVVFLIWFVNAAFPLVMMAIWVGLAQSGDISGYSAADFVSYYLIALLVRRITGVGIVQDIENLVRTGELSAHLLRPMNVMHHFVARILTSRILNVPIIAIPVIIALVLTPGIHLAISLPSVAMFVVACAIGLAFEFVGQYTIGGLSFWFTQAHGISAGYNLAKSFLGGYIVPLALFPSSMQTILRLLPFQSTVALPVEILIGKVDLQQALVEIVVCIGWTALIGLLGRALWQMGLRSYSAVGA